MTFVPHFTVWAAIPAVDFGALAEPHQHEQRHVLSVLLQQGGSFTAAARVLQMHHNTVAYRARRAEETLGYRLTQHRLRTATALRIAEIILS